jgi:hypothetical protein
LTQETNLIFTKTLFLLGDGSVGQLCWSNESLLVHLTESVKIALRSSPDAGIISVSQNDNGNFCQSAEELAIIRAEGTPGGALFRGINTIADNIKAEFPTIAVDTLAYEWSHPAPKVMNPRPNVIIRLCSIEANFAQPMSDPSNAPFQKDMNAWAAISNRTYIWNYVTSFSSYMQPFPNWYVLGPNIQYFAAHGVKGIFEEGAYGGDGGDMNTLKDYLMGRMLWNASLHPDGVISEFLHGYFGPAAPFVRLYLDTFRLSITDKNYYMGESVGPDASYLTPMALLTAGQAFTDALHVVAGAQQQYKARVDVAKVSVYYVVLLRWEEVQGFATNESVPWPWEPTKHAAWQEFTRVWKILDVKTTHEGHCDYACFEQQVWPQTCFPNPGCDICTSCTRSVKQCRPPWRSVLCHSNNDCLFVPPGSKCGPIAADGKPLQCVRGACFSGTYSSPLCVKNVSSKLKSDDIDQIEKVNSRRLKTNKTAVASSRQISWWTNQLVDTTNASDPWLVTCCQRGTGDCGNNDPGHPTSHPSRCTNNGGVGGTISGELSAGCKHAIPRLVQMGIWPVIWLFEDDSLQSARHLLCHTNSTATKLLAVADANSGIAGFQIDLETKAPVTPADIKQLATFLRDTTAALYRRPVPLRFSADVGCNALGEGGGPLGSRCKLQGPSGVDKLYDMATYFATSYSDWFPRLQAAVDTVPLDVLGVGLLADPQIVGAARCNGTASPKVLICAAMNLSVQEIAMYGLRTTGPEPLSPPSFWLAPLERFMRGVGCDAKPSPVRVCPNGSKSGTRPATAWRRVYNGWPWVPPGDTDCCESSSQRGAGWPACSASCAKTECEATSGMVNIPLNKSVHPYLCCRAKRPVPALKLDDMARGTSSSSKVVKGRLLVDGQHFFVNGFYVDSLADNDWQYLVDGGFNTILSYTNGNQHLEISSAEASLNGTQDFLDQAASHHIKVFLSLKDMYTNARHCQNVDCDAVVHAIVTRFRTHSALLGWVSKIFQSRPILHSR